MQRILYMYAYQQSVSRNVSSLVEIRVGCAKLFDISGHFCYFFQKINFQPCRSKRSEFCSVWKKNEKKENGPEMLVPDTFMWFIRDVTIKLRSHSFFFFLWNYCSHSPPRQLSLSSRYFPPTCSYVWFLFFTYILIVRRTYYSHRILYIMFWHSTR